MAPMTGQEFPLVSIGMLVYNAEELLDETLRNLVRQDYKSLEIILCDDASTDTTASICRVWAERDSRIRYHRNASNLGAWRNMLRVFELCGGPYFMWAAHDDVYDEHFVSALLQELEAH